MSRNLRTLNHTAGQKIEAAKVLTRIGDIEMKNLGTFARMFLFNSGKGLVMGGGLLVTPSSGMTLSVGAGNLFQRLDSGDIKPGIAPTAQTITLDSASGSSRTDTIQCQVTSTSAKSDSAEVITDPTTGDIIVETIYRDKSYSITIGKLTNSTTATPATAGKLTGTVAIGTINLSAKYLLNISDGEDASFIEIDLRGASPASTTLSEIVTNINTAVGRTIASVSGSYLVLTGSGLGETSYFEIKPPVASPALDCFADITGVAAGGYYNYIYQGTNGWIKLAEVAVGASAVVITSGNIKNLTQKASWASDGTNVYTYALLQGLGTTDTPTFAGLTSSAAVNITDATVSSSYTTGALIVGGGVGIAGSLYVNGTIHGAFSVGSVSAPSIYFTGDTNTGLYHSASHQIAIAINGIQTAIFESDKFVVKTSLYLDGGLYSSAGEDTDPPYHTFFLRSDYAANVSRSMLLYNGLNSTSCSVTFDISTYGDAYRGLSITKLNNLIGGESSGMASIVNGDGSLYLGVNNGDVNAGITINIANGFVGIDPANGLSSPSYALDIAGAIRATGGRILTSYTASSPTTRGQVYTFLSGITGTSGPGGISASVFITGQANYSIYTHATRMYWTNVSYNEIIVIYNYKGDNLIQASESYAAGDNTVLTGTLMIYY